MYESDDPVALDISLEMMPRGIETLDQSHIIKRDGATYYRAGCGCEVELTPGKPTLYFTDGTTKCSKCLIRDFRDWKGELE